MMATIRSRWVEFLAKIVEIEDMIHIYLAKLESRALSVLLQTATTTHRLLEEWSQETFLLRLLYRHLLMLWNLLNTEEQ